MRPHATSRAATAMRHSPTTNKRPECLCRIVSSSLLPTLISTGNMRISGSILVIK